MDYRVVLTNGQQVDIRGGEVVEDDPAAGQLVFQCGRARYRFYWPNVAYYVARVRP